MEQKTDRGSICPLDIVQDQQDWLFLGYGAQYIGDLLEELALFHLFLTCPMTFGMFPQLREPGSNLWPGGGRAGQKRFSWHKDI